MNRKYICADCEHPDEKNFFSFTAPLETDCPYCPNCGSDQYTLPLERVDEQLHQKAKKAYNDRQSTWN